MNRSQAWVYTEMVGVDKASTSVCVAGFNLCFHSHIHRQASSHTLKGLSQGLHHTQNYTCMKEVS